MARKSEKGGKFRNVGSGRWGDGPGTGVISIIIMEVGKVCQA